MSQVAPNTQLVFHNLDTATSENHPVTPMTICSWKIRYLIESYWGEIGSLDGILKGYFAGDTSTKLQRLHYFSELNRNCKLYATTSEGKRPATAEGVGRAFEIGSKIVKFDKFDTILASVRVLLNLPFHPHLNRFLGIVYFQKQNPPDTVNEWGLFYEKFGFVFEKIEGRCLADSDANLANATTIATVYHHLGNNGIIYDDFAHRNVMMTSQGQIIVIDYDACCYQKTNELLLKVQRQDFGWWLENDAEMQSVALQCQSNLSFTDFGWTHILHELRKLR